MNNDKKKVHLKKCEVYLIEINSMGGKGTKEIHDVVFRYPDAAHVYCEWMNEEWKTYKPFATSVEGELLDNERVVVENRVYRLRNETKTSLVAKKAIAKLNREEIVSLHMHPEILSEVAKGVEKLERLKC